MNCHQTKTAFNMLFLSHVKLNSIIEKIKVKRNKIKFKNKEKTEKYHHSFYKKVTLISFELF